MYAQYAAILLFAVLPCSAFEAQVVGVADGDTVTVLDAEQHQVRIRVAGIDAPEKKQPFGNRARQAMTDFCFRERVDVDGEKHDRYRRLVAKVRCRDKDAGLEMIRQGLAWHYKAYEKEQSPADRAAYAEAEEAARSAGIGLWRDPEPAAPWEWRRNKLPR